MQKLQILCNSIFKIKCQAKIHKCKQPNIQCHVTQLQTNIQCKCSQYICNLKVINHIKIQCQCNQCIQFKRHHLKYNNLKVINHIKINFIKLRISGISKWLMWLHKRMWNLLCCSMCTLWFELLSCYCNRKCHQRFILIYKISKI